MILLYFAPKIRKTFDFVASLNRDFRIFAKKEREKGQKREKKK